MSNNIEFFRLFSALVYMYYVGIDQQASRAGRQSPNRFGGHPAVVTEYGG
jgi:hypothetical protein